MQKKKKVVNFALSPEQITWLHDQAARRQCSMSQIIRDLIHEAQRKIFA